MTHHQVVLYGGLAMMALGALVLLMIILSMVGGLCYRLFMVTSGQASIRRRRKGTRRMVREPIPPSLDSILSNGASDKTQPMEAIRD